MAQKAEISIGYVKTAGGRYQLAIGAGSKVAQIGGAVTTVQQVKSDASDLIDVLYKAGVDARYIGGANS